jgi:hypothetical protein
MFWMHSETMFNIKQTKKRKFKGVLSIIGILWCQRPSRHLIGLIKNKKTRRTKLSSCKCQGMKDTTELSLTPLRRKQTTISNSGLDLTKYLNTTLLSPSFNSSENG